MTSLIYALNLCTKKIITFDYSVKITCNPLTLFTGNNFCLKKNFLDLKENSINESIKKKFTYSFECSLNDDNIFFHKKINYYIYI